MGCKCTSMEFEKLLETFVGSSFSHIASCSTNVTVRHVAAPLCISLELFSNLFLGVKKGNNKKCCKVLAEL